MRARLIFLVGATSSLVVVAFLIPLAVLVRSSVEDRVLSAAIVATQSLASTVATVDSGELARTVAARNAQGGLQFTVFLPAGTTVGAPADRSPAVVLAAAGRSVDLPVPGGREVAVAVSGLPEGTAVVRTVVPDADLTAGVARAWTVLALLGIGLLVVSLLVASLLARQLIRPLSAVAAAAHRLAHGSLGARAVVEGPPEVRQVSAGLNLLAARITELLAQERSTVADISHRVRTPLTALRIDVESMTNEETRSRLLADLDAVDRTVDDIIREGDRPVREGVAVACDAGAVVAQRVQFWSVVAEEHQRKVAIEVPRGPVPVRVSEDELAACVDALIGNVFTHTPVGAALAVSVSRPPAGGARLTVADGGPGMPEGAVLKRGTSGAGSTGLGLDIVVRTAARSGGGARIRRSGLGGAEVVVDFGPPEPPLIRSHRESRRRGSGT